MSAASLTAQNRKLRPYRRWHLHRHQFVEDVEDTEMEIKISDIHVHLHIKPDPEVLARLDDIQDMLGLVLHKEDIIMSAQTDALDQAEAAAAANSAADDSAEGLMLELVRLYKEAAANSNDPAVTARIQALGQAITDRSKRLADAVVANTPAATP